MERTTVLWERLPGRVGLLTLNRPERLNALSGQMWQEISATLREADRDPEVRAIVVRGAGRAFSAGADIGSGASPRNILEWYESEMESVPRHRIFRELTKPTIGAVHGWCLGWGFEMACSLDMLVAAEDAKFGAPEIRHGSMVASILPLRIGPMWAKRLIFTGDIITAQKAKEIGLVLEVLPSPEGALEAALALARRIALVPPLGVRFNKRMVDGVMEALGSEMAVAYGSLVSAICHSLLDLAENAEGQNLEAIRRSQGLKLFLEARECPFRPGPGKEPWVVQ
ncbi:MAG: enoyl-CoA hydratase/isomerase family protein [Dehalococcoidia bacterium]|nr:enoyl-CoA hydratase/isomerase family protein [Dehalococcoidia bacterium]MDW8120003.1 enoyl-CoA hydratase/isomerase family protein [Chloroflexota bacterium]